MARIVGKTVGKSTSSSGIAFTSDSKKIIDVVKMYMTGLNFCISKEFNFSFFQV